MLLIPNDGLREVQAAFLQHRRVVPTVAISAPDEEAAAGFEASSGDGGANSFAHADTLVIHTTEPDRVYDRVPELVLADDLRVREIAPADENLEAVFGYLTDQRV